MQLDPAAARVLQDIEEGGKGEPEPTNDAERLAKARRDAAALGRFSRPAPAGIARRDVEVPAGDGGPAIPVRLYGGPDEGERPRLLVWFHGGGTIAGSLDVHEPVLVRLAERTGRAVAAVDYRLAPEAVFPAQHDECLRAARWLAENAERLGLSCEAWAVGGDSVGGLYAAATALSLRDENFAPSLGAQILVYPNTDLRDGRPWPSIGENDGRIMTRASLLFEARTAVPDAADRDGPRASPFLAADLSRLPPAFLATGEADPLRDEGRAFGERLAEAGVPLRDRRYAGMIHAFLQMDDRIPAADELRAEIADFLRDPPR